ncbi:MAG: SAP domain-containing protein [Bradymonadia bacterium]
MLTRRRILETLAVAELRRAADVCGVLVADRRSRRTLVDTLSSSRRVSILAVLQELTVKRLRELCRLHGLDSEGRKASLLERLDPSRTRRSPKVATGGRGIEPNPSDASSAAQNPQKVGGSNTAVHSPASRIPVRPSFPVGRYVARQCFGAETSSNSPSRHTKPFLGIANIAAMDYCEISGVIKQFAAQEEFAGASENDDNQGGVCAQTYPRLNSDYRSRIAERIRTQARTAETWEDRFRRGQLAEDLELEGTYSERRHFDFGEFLVIGMPDALVDSTAMEFSSSRRPELNVLGKTIQANLYAVLWGLPESLAVSQHPEFPDVRVERRRLADPVEAERVLARAWAVMSGAESGRPPSTSRKCARCKFEKMCPFPSAGRVPSVEEMRRIGESSREPELMDL